MDVGVAVETSEPSTEIVSAEVVEDDVRAEDVVAREAGGGDVLTVVEELDGQHAAISV